MYAALGDAPVSACYSISVTNTGIVLAGPGSTVRLACSAVTVESASTTTVKGAVVQLNGGASCAPVVRRTDLIPVPEHAGATFAATGSASVCTG